MQDLSERYLLQLHPANKKSEYPVNDTLTDKMEKLLSSAKKGTQYRGWHNCTGCGEMSGSCDLIVGPYITNSLAAHYLRWHRNDAPESEINKLKKL
uniref:Uncharacterized protein n=1 Tax=viral metagenome TaxID=1070528 RepID=A0A6M3KFL2_9ZZZZ